MSVGCVIIHGLTGTPATVITLKETFLSSGFMVDVPLLAGHGASVETMSQTGWKDWYESVKIAYDTVKGNADDVFCIGISLGALLSLKLAAEEGAGIRGLVLLSTPLRLPFFDRAAISIVKHTPLRSVIREVKKDFSKSVEDAFGRAMYRNASLPVIPSHSAFEIADLQKRILPLLKDVDQPILAMHGDKDTIARVDNVELLKRSVSSRMFENIIFKKSSHVLTLDYDRDEVAKHAVAFCKKVANENKTITGEE